MNKKSAINLLLTLLMNMVGLQAFADWDTSTKVNVDGLYYYLDKDNCEAQVTSMPSGKYFFAITIPSSFKYNNVNYSVTSIGENAFYDWNYITSIEIPNSVTSIGDYAFYSCSGLTSIDIPNSVTSIGYYAFKDTPWYDNQPDGLVYAGKVAYQYKGTMPANTSISIEEGTLGIGGGAFYGCSGLTSIEIPNSVTSIGNSTFSGCSGLTSIEIPNSVTSIGSYAFSGCSGLTSITIPNSVTSIGYNAFENCTGLNSIVVEKGNSAYDSRENCNAIIETTTNTLIKGCNNTIIPNDVTIIGDYAFFGCTGFTSITIPNSVTSIGYNAFCANSSLTSVTIGYGVTSIGQGAFWGCSKLSTIKIYAKNPPSAYWTSFPNDNNNISAIQHDPSNNKYKIQLFAPQEYLTYYQNLSWARDQYGQYDSPLGFFISYNPLDIFYSIEVTENVQNKSRQASFSIDLTNESADLTAYQFDLTLPEGFSLSEDDKGKFLVTKTNRYEDDSHILNITKMEGNTYRFVCFSLSNEIITGTSGAILNATLTIGESIKEGRYKATISNVIVTNTHETQLKPNDSKFNIMVNFIKGDANGDGEVNVTDIVEIVNYIMNKPSNKFIFSVADMNDDGKVDVTDIVKEVSLIMSSGSNAPKRASVAEMVDNDQLEMTSNDNKTLSLNLQNEGSYVASQFDIVLSAGQTLESIQLNSKRMENHQLTYTKTGDNRYKVVIYSLNNAAYKGQSGELLNIKVAGSGDVSVEDILFVTAGQMEKNFPPLRRGTTGISLTTNEAETMDIYSIDGRLIRKQAKSTDGLEKGLYIINGKKQIVR